MKKVRLALAATALCTLGFAVAPAGASCAPGASDGTVLHTVEQTGSTLYRTADGAGIKGSIGYLEGGAGAGGASLHGATADGAVNGAGAVGADGSASLCVNDTQVL